MRAARKSGGRRVYHQVLACPGLGAATTRRVRFEIDSTVSEARLQLADVDRMLDMDWDAAEAGYTRALALNPSNEAALRAFGLTLALQARYAEGAAHIEQARELDPLCLATSTQDAWMRYLAGDYEGSIATCARTISMDPEFVGARRVQAAALLQLGRAEEASAQLELALNWPTRIRCAGLGWHTSGR